MLGCGTLESQLLKAGTGELWLQWMIPNPKPVDPKQIPSDEPKREHRERREHRSGGGNLSTASSINRLR
jgi:hypothetical protein